MANVIFYEKPGCINNSKQKTLLITAGHQVEARNLLTTSWTTNELRAFFGNLPVSAWFNPTAPSIKSGAVNPHKITEEEALNLMVKNPLLIRRPLMAIGKIKLTGFDLKVITAVISLSPIDQVRESLLIPQDLETCPKSNTANHQPCQISIC